MVNDSGINNENIIVRELLGNQTGDVRYQTADGRWWEPYQGGYINTGDEVRTLWRIK